MTKIEEHHHSRTFLPIATFPNSASNWVKTLNYKRGENTFSIFPNPEPLTGGARDPRRVHGANPRAPHGSPAYMEHGEPPAGRPGASKRRALGPLPNPSDAFAIRPLSTPRRAPKKTKAAIGAQARSSSRAAAVRPPPTPRPTSLHSLLHRAPPPPTLVIILASTAEIQLRRDVTVAPPSLRFTAATTLHRLPVLQTPTPSSASAPRAQRARYRHRHRLLHLFPRAPLARTRATHGLTVESLPTALSAPPLRLRRVRRVATQLKCPLAPPFAASTAGSTPRRRATPSSRGFGSPPPLRLSSPPPATRNTFGHRLSSKRRPPPLARPRLSSRRARLCPEREEEEERIRDQKMSAWNYFNQR
ncbi:hypothetical protein U9M48_020028 [Paspalum notatum var. saurae]|uniref:Uncharacterized protein n=1 Tax=Paspalum notatum var. saurae TaxID=547442 RepID=A0AAQ3WS47_PASNO